MTSIDQLKQIIGATLSPNPADIKNAEASLKVAQTSQGHAKLVLQLVAASAAPQEAHIRQAAAVHFKNVIKKGWTVPDEEQEDLSEGIRLDESERVAIKDNLVQLMCTTPPQIQAQLSEAISIIAQTDYYQKWETLMPSLVQQFENPDIATVVGVLKTANAILKMFRDIPKSDALYEVIQYTLSGICGPLTALMNKLGQAVATPAILQNKPALVLHMEALRLVCRIFYSLNWQELPEFFEDNMGVWMEEFQKYLQPNIFSILEDPDEEDEPSALDNLQVAIVMNLQLYSYKDEEVFVENFVKPFTSLVWDRLMTTSGFPKHDVLVTTSIKFLSSLVEKPMHAHLFDMDGVLPNMVEKIVIPNITFRQVDEERFEDDPQEYMVTEVEGSDSGSRRRCAQDLLNNMCRQMEEKTTKICQQHIQALLQNYALNPNENWAAKDAAIHLFMGVAIRRENFMGVSEVNPNVDLIQFFSGQIIPELQDSNHHQRPVVKAAAIKFVTTFRKQFSRDNCVQLLPVLIAHLSSPVIVVHTFAAYAIERMLLIKDEQTRAAVVGVNELKPFLDPLFRGLFTIVDNTELNENAYVMKCVMRALITARRDILPVTEHVIQRLTAALERVAKNPRNPHFNHCLFESLAVLIKSVCSVDPSNAESFEGMLMSPFTSILQMDIAEFTPYVFQLFAQLLEFRPRESGLGDFYSNFFTMLKHPQNWEKRGNIPALSRLVSAYIEKAAAQLVNEITPILGIFQKLMMIKATETQGMQILNSVVIHFDQTHVQPYATEIFRILLSRLQRNQSKKYVGLLASFFGLFAAKNGGAAISKCMESMQNGLTATVVDQFWSSSLLESPPIQRIEAKIQMVGVTRFLFEEQGLSFFDSSPGPWVKMVLASVKILSSSSFSQQVVTAGLDDDEMLDMAYDAQFAELKQARPSSMVDPFPERTNPAGDFVQGLARVSQQRAGQLVPLLQEYMGKDAKAQQQLQSLLQVHGVRLA